MPNTTKNHKPTWTDVKWLPASDVIEHNTKLRIAFCAKFHIYPNAQQGSRAAMPKPARGCE